MKERPILFNQEMVRAILSGQKTQTRRPAKDDKPPCEVGDILWVRETFGYDGDEIVYRASARCEANEYLGKWKPSIHMRREESRIELEVMAVELQCLGDITGSGAIDEGIKINDYVGRSRRRYKDYLCGGNYVGDPRVSFISLFRSIYGIDIKSSIPVWAITFRVHRILEGKN